MSRPTATDRCYTPDHLATRMVGYVTRRRPPLVVADFAAGDGELLRAAQKRWPGASIIATDIDPKAVSTLKREEPDWLVGTADFLNPRSRSRCSVLHGAKGTISIALLNPPFSCLGAKACRVVVRGSELRCSPAMAFVLGALDFLATDGEIVAVLPAGSLHTQKDQDAWSRVRRLCRCQILEANHRTTFPGCYPQTVVMRLVLRSEEAVERRRPGPRRAAPHADTIVGLVRGTLQMHAARPSRNGTVPLVHSTELQNGRVDIRRRRVGHKHRVVRGPAVLIPRVGQPRSSKIALYLSKRTIAISDCVLAVTCQDSRSARDLRHRLSGSCWAQLRRCYNGTCAPYITVAALTDVLRGIGLRVERHRLPAGTRRG
jgi:hypothetical protein